MQANIGLYVTTTNPSMKKLCVDMTPILIGSHKIAMGFHGYRVRRISLRTKPFWGASMHLRCRYVYPWGGHTAYISIQLKSRA